MRLNEMNNTMKEQNLGKYEAPASMDFWDNFTDFATEQINNSQLEESRAYKLRLAYEELISNIIRYANDPTQESTEGARLEVSFALANIDSETWIILKTKDTGLHFDPNFYHRSPVDTDQPVAERQIGGLGIFLIEQSVDKVTYEWIDNKNVYELKMSCSKN